MKQIRILLPVLMIVLMMINSSCRKEPDTGLSGVSGIYIINEGNFNFGNGDVSVYELSSGTVKNNLFSSSNGYSPGDVVQSMYVKDSLGYLVVNNSQKIEVVALPGFTRIRTITIPGASPRYFLPVSDSLAYVTDLYALKIHVINFHTGNLVKQINTSGWNEQMILNGNYVFVTQRSIFSSASSKGGLLKINALSNSLNSIKSFSDRDVTGIVKDNTGNIWISVAEDSTKSEHASLLSLDTDMNVLRALAYNDYGQSIYGLSVNHAESSVYWLNKNVYRLKYSDTSMPQTPFIDGSGQNIYALGVHPNGTLFTSNALDFVQPGVISRYDSNGQFWGSFTAGVIPGNFVFP